jgi:predicted  nucleic acid-binding Zn-ribbon protein
MESVEGDLELAEKELKARTEQVRESIRQHEESVPGVESELARLAGQRAATEAMLQADLLSRYRRIADARRGIALAEATGELCGACHVRIRPQVYANLFKNEDLYYCDSCSRILFLRDHI